MWCMEVSHHFCLFSVCCHISCMTLQNSATRWRNAPECLSVRMSSHRRLLLQNCTTFIHLRLFSFYFTFGFTPLPSPTSRCCCGFLYWKKPVQTIFIPVLNSRRLNRDDSADWKWDFNLILHWWNWFLLHFTGHHAIQRKRSRFISVM